MPGHIPEEFIRNLVSQVDIVEIIGSRLSLRKTGSNFFTCCPFHKEKTPSFSVSQVKQMYNCFGCGAAGDVIQFLVDYEGIPFVEAVENLAAKFGLELPNQKEQYSQSQYKLIYNILEKSAAYFELQLRSHPMANKAILYLKHRGLKGIVAKKFRLGFAPPGWKTLCNFLIERQESLIPYVQAGMLISKENGKYCDRFQDRVMFPIHDHKERIIGFGARVIDVGEPKYLNSPQTIVFNKGQELYGLYNAIKAIKINKSLLQIIVVEGYMDVLALVQANINNVVATLGTACTNQHIQNLFKYTSEIVFCFDGDSAGEKAAWRALETSLPFMTDRKRVKFLLLPPNHDPDSYVRMQGAEAFLTKLNQAVSLPDFLFNSLTKQTDVSQIDDRVYLADKIKFFLNKLPEGIFKQMMFERLGILVGLDPILLQANIKSDIKSDIKLDFKSGKKSKEFNLPLLSPAVRALGLLICYRELINILPAVIDLEQVDMPGNRLFCAVATILKQEHNLSDQEIAVKLPVDLARYFLPNELRAIAHKTPASGVQQEFLGAIELIKKRKRDQMIDSLLDKAKNNILSEDEKKFLQHMLLCNANE